MNLSRLISLLFLFVLNSFVVSAQTTELEIKEKKANKIKNVANNALRSGDIYTALEYYKKLADLKPDDTKVLYQLAEVYYLSRNYKEAEVYYQQVKDKDAASFDLVLYKLALSQKQNTKYEEAKENLDKFRKIARNLKDPSYKKLCRVAKEGCDLAIALKDTSANAVVQNLGDGINRPHIEFAPVPLSDDELLFGALHEDEVRYYDLKEDSVNLPIRKFYTAKKNGDKWETQGEFEGPFNTEDVDVGNGTFSLDGDRFYFSRCTKNFKGKVICNLYVSNLEKGNWTEPETIEILNFPNYTTTQPSFGRESRKNREVIYFVSDRPGGKGGLDIWYSTYDAKKKTFKTPKNCGFKINSPGTDCTPFYNLKTRTLYYSSDAHPGIGGLDVFTNVGEGLKWEGPPSNIGAPVNSPQDDLYFILNEDSKGGFLVSNRVGGTALLSETCCDDIYSFKWTAYISINLLTKISGTEDCLRGSTAKIYVLDESKNKTLAFEKTVDDCTISIPLEQGQEYSIEFDNATHKTDSIYVDTRSITESISLEEKISLKPKPTPKPVPVEPTPQPEPQPVVFENKVVSKEQPIRLEGILYEFNSAQLTADSRTKIDQKLIPFLQDNPSIRIQLSSHTDNKGTDAYNLKLSQNRAQSVVDYLIKKGINPTRLQAKGYGETQPIAANQNEDGSDNPEGRKLNRRTEFRILK